MISDHLQKCLLAVILFLIPIVNLQIPVPMYPMGPQIYALPPPPPIAVPVPVPIPFAIKIKETTTTTTTEKSNDNNNFYMAIPFPVPVPAYPRLPPPPPPPPPLPPPRIPHICFETPKRPKNCPDCPNCPPVLPIPPMPAPVMPFIHRPYMLPPPVVVLPLPPLFHGYRKRISKYSEDEDSYDDKGCDKYSSDDDSDSTDYDEDSDTEDSDESESRFIKYPSYKKRQKIGHAKRRPVRSRRFQRDIFDNVKTHVRPVLSYLDKHGETKLRQKLSKDEAFKLIENDRLSQMVQIDAGLDSDEGHRVKIKSKYETKSPITKHAPIQLQLQAKPSDSGLSVGKKEIIFRPPANKKISNLSLSFQIV